MRSVVWMVLGVLLGAGCLGGYDSTPTKSGTPSESATTSSPPPATPTGTSPAKGSFKLTKIVEGLDRPLYVTHADDESGRIFVVEQPGRIRVIKDGTLAPNPFLDVTSLVQSSGTEQGLLSVAFYPDYDTTGRFVVDYTRVGTGAENGDTVVARYKALTPSADQADPTSAEVLLTQDQPQTNHNGGLVKFGPDGMLYIGFGDGGAAADVGPGHAPEGNGQSLSTWLGKLLRIDVSGPGAYRVPPDNPNLGASARPEIWAYGLRNPWRFSFDRATGDLYLGDVGQNAWEEIDHQSASSRGGENYGWPVWEGTHLHRPGVVLQHTPPVAEYANPAQGCSVTGGYVYRGALIPALQGYYILGDYCSGTVWTLAKVSGNWALTPLIQTELSISSFGEDESGELYVTDLKGSVYRFDPA